MGAWETLHLASKLHIENIHMIRDSRVIIDWLNNHGKLQINTLMAWKDRINILKCLFKELPFSHSSREYNMEANLLSKSTLLRQARVLFFNHWLDGHEGPMLAINFFRTRSTFCQQFFAYSQSFL
jgi:hypothetical protein